MPNNEQKQLLASIVAAIVAVTACSEELEPVTVFAQKWGQSADDIGASVAVFSDDDIRNLQLAYADDIAAHEPNVALNKPFGNSNPVVVIRGVGLLDFNINNSPSVGIYVDESHLASNAMADFVLLDIERVEILKGPQGALWGKNATGGAVLYSTRRPAIGGHDGYVDVTHGSGERTGQGALSIPLGSSLAGRLAVLATDRYDEPYFSRALVSRFGKHSQVAGRISLAWSPDEATDAALRVEVGRYKGDSTPLVHVGIAGAYCPVAVQPPTRGGRDEARCTNTTTGYSDPDGSIDAGDWNYVPRTERRSRTAALRVGRRFAATEFISVSSVSTLDYQRGEDDDASGLPLLQLAYDSALRSYSQEIRWSSQGSERLRWLVGAQGSRDALAEHRVASFDALFGPALSNVTLRYKQELDSASLFAQAEKPLTSHFQISAGLRYEVDTLKFKGGTAPGPGAYDSQFVAAAFPGLPAEADLKKTWQNVAAQLSLQLRPGPTTMVYGNLTRGYKPGGVFGGFGLTPWAFSPYHPENILAAEIGTKWQHAQGRMSIQGAAFVYDYRDIQAQTLVSATTGALAVLGNAGKARIAGVESSLLWVPHRSVTLTGGIGLLRTRLQSNATSMDSLQRPVPLDDKELPSAPQWSMHGTLSLNPSVVWAGWRPHLDLNISALGDYWNDLPNQQHLRQTRATILLGGSASATSVDEHWNISLWGRNLRNERYILHGNSSGIGNDLLMYSEGRSFGLRVRYDWNARSK